MLVSSILANRREIDAAFVVLTNSFCQIWPLVLLVGLAACARSNTRHLSLFWGQADTDLDKCAKEGRGCLQR